MHIVCPNCSTSYAVEPASRQRQQQTIRGAAPALCGARCRRARGYTWTATPGRSVLVSGEKLKFRSRFVSPPDNAVDVMVRFINAQDATCKPARVGK